MNCSVIFNCLSLIAVVAAVILSAGGCTTAPQKPTILKIGDYQYLKEYLSWSILKDMKKHNVKGLSIAIVDGQKIVWTKGFGLADEEKNLSTSSQTIYRIGSISKVITATEIMRLHQSGKIDIDQPVTTYIKDFSVRSRFKNTHPVTLRSLLSHHSGLPSDIIAGMWVQNPISVAELVHSIKDESLASPPQTMYKYSNIGFSILGRIIEVIENKPFSKAMSDNFLQPLGMQHSSFALTPQMEKFYSKGYREGKEAERTPLRDLPAGAMLSNVEDMGRFIQFVFSDGNLGNKTIVKPKILEEIFSQQFAGLELDFGHKVGLGWVLGGLRFPTDDHLAWHNGAGTPHQAHISLLPDRKLGVIILANTDEARHFITDLGIKGLQLALQAKTGKSIPAQEQIKDIVPVSVPNKTLDNYAGQYVVFGNMTSIKRNDSHLKIGFQGNKLDLIPVSHDTFVPKATALGFISIPLLNYSLQFKAVHDKSIALLHGLPAPFAFQKITHYKIPQTWKNRLGSYEINTLDELFSINNLQLVIEDGVLLFNVTVQAKSANKNTKLKIALIPISDTEAVVIGLANGEGGTVRVKMDGATEKLYYSGFLLTLNP